MLEVQITMYNACLVAGTFLQLALTWLLVICCYVIILAIIAVVLRVVLKRAVDEFLRLSYRFMLTISKARRDSNV